MILVTGGAGFIGLNVVEQLAARGDALVVYDVSAPRIGVTHELGDVTDVQALEHTFAKHQPAAVIHLAAITAGRERDAREPRRIGPAIGLARRAQRTANRLGDHVEGQV